MAIGPFLLAAIGGQGGVKVCGAPGNLSLSEGGTPATQIALSWSAPSDTGGGTVSGYRIKKDGSTLVADTGSTGTTYTATGLTRVTSYNFNVAAINEAGTGADGNTPSLTTSAEVPGAPGTLSLSAGSPAQTAINLSWSAPSDTGGATITGYRIKKNGSTLVADTGSTGTTYSATGLSSSTSYNFTVAAINSIGTGADGNTPSRSTTAYNISATGGTITTAGGYRQHVFTSSGTFNITSNNDSITIDVIAVGGGGGTASGAEWCMGGAGGGAVVTTSSEAGTTGSRTVTIGAGGVQNGSTTSMNFGGYTPRRAQGGSKCHNYFTYSLNGGGGGGIGATSGSGYRSGTNSSSVDGHTGGNGGRGHRTGGQYRAGGGGGGGGGNDGSDGASSGTSALGGDGGAGDTTWYATLGGGGGGAAWLDAYNQPNSHGGDGGAGGGGAGADTVYNSGSSTAVAGVAGTVNTGGGAGGNIGIPGSNSGGSGILIIRYAYS